MPADGIIPRELSVPVFDPDRKRVKLVRHKESRFDLEAVLRLPKMARSSSMRTDFGSTLDCRVEWSASLGVPVSIALGILFALLVLFVLFRVGRAMFPKM